MLTLVKGNNPGLTAWRCPLCRKVLKGEATQVDELRDKHMTYLHPGDALNRLLQ